MFPKFFSVMDLPKIFHEATKKYDDLVSRMNALEAHIFGDTTEVPEKPLEDTTALVDSPEGQTDTVAEPNGADHDQRN